ncbi:uncharacterized, partial [Tachysurus ichikawai]
SLLEKAGILNKTKIADNGKKLRSVRALEI